MVRNILRAACFAGNKRQRIFNKAVRAVTFLYFVLCTFFDFNGYDVPDGYNTSASIFRQIC